MHIDCGWYTWHDYIKQTKTMQRKDKKKIHKLLKIILYGINGTNFGICNNIYIKCLEINRFLGHYSHSL